MHRPATLLLLFAAPLAAAAYWVVFTIARRLALADFPHGQA